jgi:hypothetical protein
MLHQLSLHRICVHVLQLFFQLLRAPHIEIVESSLPKIRLFGLTSLERQRQLRATRSPSLLQQRPSRSKQWPPPITTESNEMQIALSVMPFKSIAHPTKLAPLKPKGAAPAYSPSVNYRSGIFVPCASVKKKNLSLRHPPALTTYVNSQGALVAQRQAQDEQQAHLVSDPIAPQYVYQTCP